MEKIDIFEVLNNENSTNYTTYDFTYNTNSSYKTFNFTYKIKETSKIMSFIIWLVKYIATSATIFAVLLLTSNYSAYTELAQSYINPEINQKASVNILNSVEASKISNSIKKKITIKNHEKKLHNKKTKYSIKKSALDTNKKNIKLNIEITPYENRIIIPKIAKNIPIVEVKNKIAKNAKELENIFMKELEDWVVRYPWSTKPWKNWNTFIFGHSSNYPWIKWDYNEVFANLGKLSYWDEIIVYYWQKKYIYIVREKRTITPWETKILKRNNNKDELTLMTCWPVWTTLNRLIVISELKK